MRTFIIKRGIPERSKESFDLLEKMMIKYKFELRIDWEI